MKCEKAGERRPRAHWNRSTCAYPKLCPENFLKINKSIFSTKGRVRLKKLAWVESLTLYNSSIMHCNFDRNQYFLQTEWLNSCQLFQTISSWVCLAFSIVVNLVLVDGPEFATVLMFEIKCVNVNRDQFRWQNCPWNYPKHFWNHSKLRKTVWNVHEISIWNQIWDVLNGLRTSKLVVDFVYTLYFFDDDGLNKILKPIRKVKSKKVSKHVPETTIYLLASTVMQFEEFDSPQLKRRALLLYQKRSFIEEVLMF